MNTDQALAALNTRIAGTGSELMLHASLLADARRRVSALEAKLFLTAAGRTPTLPVEFRSQFGEDSFLWSIFDGALDGFFIEAGAFNGFDYAVTYALEAVGWKGLLVEAIPERAEECRTRRPSSRVVHAALGKKGATGATTFTVVDDAYGGMLSYHTTDARHRDFVAKRGDRTRTVTVPLTTLDGLLESQPNLPAIDAVVIDVEGGEPDVFDGFSLDRWKPRVMLVEDNARATTPQGLELGNKISAAGYVFLGWLFVSGIWIHKDEQVLITRASRLLKP